MDSSTPVQSTEDFKCVTDGDFERNPYVDENQVAGESEGTEMVLDPTEFPLAEITSNEHGFSLVLGLGVVIAFLMVLSVCNLLFRKIKGKIDAQREARIRRTRLRDEPSTPSSSPIASFQPSTSVKRVSPRPSNRTPPDCIHTSITPNHTWQWSFPENMQATSSYQTISMGNLPGQIDSGTSSETSIRPLHDRTIDSTGAFTDGITRRTLSFTENVNWSASAPEDVTLRRHSTPED